MEQVRCNLCNYDDTWLVFNLKERNLGTGDEFRLVQCKKCGLIYLNPRPDENEMERYYPSLLWPRAWKDINPKEARIVSRPWREIAKLWAQPILDRKAGGRILDVGCGDGYFLKFMQEKGWEVQGVEPSKIASQYARQRLGLNVSTEKIEDARYPESYFEAINLRHVLEHLFDPLATLKKLHRVLKDDSLLLVSVPNFHSFDFRIFRTRWVALSVPTHLYHFTHKTLQNMLKRAGFKVERVKYSSSEGNCTMGYSDSLRYLLMDLNLYPGKENLLNPAAQERYGETKTREETGKEILHNMETLIFKIWGFLMDRMGMGSNLIILAKKK